MPSAGGDEHLDIHLVDPVAGSEAGVGAADGRLRGGQRPDPVAAPEQGSEHQVTPDDARQFGRGVRDCLAEATVLVLPACRSLFSIRDVSDSLRYTSSNRPRGLVRAMPSAQVTSSPSFVHVHIATNIAAGTSAGADSIQDMSLLFTWALDHVGSGPWPRWAAVTDSLHVSAPVTPYKPSVLMLHSTPRLVEASGGAD